MKEIIKCKKCKWWRRSEFSVSDKFVTPTKEEDRLFSDWISDSPIAMCHHDLCFENKKRRSPADGEWFERERIKGQAQWNATNNCELYEERKLFWLLVWRFWPSHNFERLEKRDKQAKISPDECTLGSIVDDIHEAMDLVVDLPCGGIGSDGPTLEEMNKASVSGRPYEDDATYDIGQRIYRILEASLTKNSESTT